jgi:hypothetical protein
MGSLGRTPYAGLSSATKKPLSSYSIKKLAPVLTGRGYEGLAVGNGMLAVAEWRRVLKHGTEVEERERIRRPLLDCGLDAELMHDILVALRTRSGWLPPSGEVLPS